MSHNDLELELLKNRKSSCREEDNYNELFLTCLIRFIRLMERQELLIGNIAMKQAELAVQLNANAEQLAKVRVEIQALLDIIAVEPEVSAELQAAADSLVVAIQGVDDLNPDTPV